GRSVYILRVTGGCGCPPVELASVPAWRGEAAMTCYMGGFAPENLIRRCAVLCMSDACGSCVAEGVFRPCCGEGTACCDACRPACPPCMPVMTPRAPLYPALSPDGSIFG
ncbi:MAG: hypothetical protein J5998_11430, partial [Clostridia bacterium]|nr:hypothetical protein [Clostridia bacterium]